MIEHKLYVGANNQTGKVDLDRVISIVGRRFFRGFTVQTAIGVYMGAREQSAIVTIIADERLSPRVEQTIEELVEELEQESVLHTAVALLSTNLK